MTQGIKAHRTLTAEMAAVQQFLLILNPDRINWAKSGGTAIAEIYKEPPCRPINRCMRAPIDAPRRSTAAKLYNEAWVAYGNMLGTYYGHDHKNTFVTTTQHGIDIGYGKELRSTRTMTEPRIAYLRTRRTNLSTESVTESDLAKVLVKFTRMAEQVP
jgi:hypothetical protein